MQPAKWDHQCANLFLKTNQFCLVNATLNGSIKVPIGRKETNDFLLYKTHYLSHIATLFKKDLTNFQVTKKTKFLHSHEVSFFTGCKAVDALLNDSPWSKAKVVDPEKSEIVFDSREQCSEFLDELLKQKMFHRAKKIPVNFNPLTY